MLHSTRIMIMYNFILQNVRQITSYSFILLHIIAREKYFHFRICSLANSFTRISFQVHAKTFQHPPAGLQQFTFKQIP